MDNSHHTNDDTTEEQESPKWLKQAYDLANVANKSIRAYESGKQFDPSEFFSKVASIISEKSSEGSEQNADIASGEIDYEAQVQKRKETVGTGFAKLNAMLNGGLESSRMLAILGGPGGGKTTLANQIAVHVADSGRPVLYVTCEDIPFNLLCKTLARQGRVDYSAVLKRYEDKRTVIDQALADYRASLASTRLRYLDATVGTSLAIVKACAAAHFKAFESGGSGILVIDYLQRLARSLQEYREGRQDLRLAVTGISEELRRFATELDCTVITLASMNRASGYSVKDSSLMAGKESGDIEYAVDVQMALGDDPERLPTNEWLVPKSIRIDKNRQGTTGIINLDWYGSRQQFTEAPDDVEVDPLKSNGSKKGGKK